MKRLKIVNIGPGVKDITGPKTDVNDVLGMSSQEVTAVINDLGISATLEFSVLRRPSTCIARMEDQLINDWRIRRALIVFFLANIGLASQEDADAVKPPTAAVN